VPSLAHWRIVLVVPVAVSAGLLACGDASTLAPRSRQISPGSVITGSYECVAIISTRTVSCTPTASPTEATGQPQAAALARALRGTARDTVVSGTQGQYWSLNASGFAFNSATGLFSMDVSATNDLAMAMGTNDGVTTTGLSIFLASGPTPVAGTGTISVDNATGSGDFTAPGQKYFYYDQVLAPGKTSASNTWQFTIPSTATGIMFSVELYTGIPPFRTPAGYTLIDSTGPITTTPPAAGGTINLGVNGSGDPVPWTFYSDANLSLTSASDPSSTGYRISFPSTLAGGYAAANWETDNTVAQTGYLYFRYKVRIDPRWTNAGNVSTNFMYLSTPNGNGCTPETQGPAVAGLSGGTASDLYVTMTLQCDVSRDLGGANSDGTVDSAASNVSVPNANIWHTVEMLAQPETALGTSGNGVFTEWVDGLEVAHVTDVNYWAASNTQIGWTSIKMQSTYGGGPNSPPALTPAIWQDVDQIYMAVK
jgi:hypothetical protein